MKTKKRVISKKAAPTVVVPAKPKSKAWAIILSLLVIVGLLGQAVWVFYRERKAQVTLNFEANIAARGQGIGEVSGCRHMSHDAQGNLFYLQGVGDACTLQKFARDGKLLGRVAPDAPLAARLNNSFAVAGDANGGAWVVERGTGALKHYSPDLKWLSTMTMPNGDLTGVAVAPDGKVWAASFNGILFAHQPGTPDAKPFQGQKKGRLRAPFRLAFDAEGNFYVLDFDQGVGKDASIKVYDSKFMFLRSWVVKDQPANEFMCIAFHPQGYVVVNDTRPEVVDAKGFRIYSPQGSLKGVATLTNTGQNIRAIPGFAITPQGDWYLDMTPLQQGCGRLSWMPTF